MAFVLLPQTFYSQNIFQLGVNLVENGAFVNIINDATGYSLVKSFDNQGWPQSDFELLLMDGRPATEWTGTIDDPEKYRINYSGRYKSSLKGWANVAAKWATAAIENKSYDSATNTTYFDVVIGGYPNANHGMVFLTFTGTKRTLKDTVNSGISNLKVNRPGYDINSNKIFTDEYLNLCRAANFACYRFYGVQNIWDGEPTYPKKTTWDIRKTPADGCQLSMVNINGKSDGWCWEYIVELANILKKDIWINIHISCDSVYVDNLANFLRTKLNPSINIYVENSNEVWSPTQTTHGPYNKAEADNFKITFDQNYARRCVELSNWFGNVFGKNEINKRIRVILASQESYNGRSDNHLNYIKNTFGDPKTFIYATSPALYFGSTNDTSTDTTLINNGMIDDIKAQINDNKSAEYRLNHINKAKNWGLIGGCTSYEGGPGIPAGGGMANLGNQILANRTWKMNEILKLSYIDGWKNLGGGLAIYFTLASGYNRYGCWGITDDYTKPDRNYKMQAIREIIGQPSGVNEEKELTDFPIYPNPAHEFVMIKDNEMMIKKVVIYNCFGEIVEYVNLNTNNYKLDVTNYVSGIYYVRTGNKIMRFVKL